MSGGHFDYKQYVIGDIQQEIENIVKENKNKTIDEYGDTIGRFYPKEVIEKFKETIKLLEKTDNAIHAIDYLLSCDTGCDSFLDEWKRKLVNNCDDIS